LYFPEGGRGARSFPNFVVVVVERRTAVDNVKGVVGELGGVLFNFVIGLLVLVFLNNVMHLAFSVTAIASSTLLPCWAASFSSSSLGHTSSVVVSGLFSLSLSLSPPRTYPETVLSNRQT
jgi:hypothetical protein